MLESPDLNGLTKAVSKNSLFHNEILIGIFIENYPSFHSKVDNLEEKSLKISTFSIKMTKFSI